MSFLNLLNLTQLFLTNVRYFQFNICLLGFKFLSKIHYGLIVRIFNLLESFIQQVDRFHISLDLFSWNEWPCTNFIETISLSFIYFRQKPLLSRLKLSLKVTNLTVECSFNLFLHLFEQFNLLISFLCVNLQIYFGFVVFILQSRCFFKKLAYLSEKFLIHICNTLFKSTKVKSSLSFTFDLIIHSLLFKFLHF